LEQNEQRMASIGAEKDQLEQLLTTTLSPADMADAGRRLKALADEAIRLEDRWLELTEQLEASV
jgi:ATP-binding cassette subfamily F protein 3